MTDGRPSPWFRPQEEKGVGAPRRTGTVTGRGEEKDCDQILKGTGASYAPTPRPPPRARGAKVWEQNPTAF